MNLIPSRPTYVRTTGLTQFHPVLLAVLLLGAWSCERQEGGVVDPQFTPSLSLAASLAASMVDLDSPSPYCQQNPDGSYQVTDTVVAAVPVAGPAPGTVTFRVTRTGEIFASGSLSRSGSLSSPAADVYLARFTFRLERSETGRYTVEVSAAGGRSIALSLIVTKAGSAPVPGVPTVRQLTAAVAESVKFFTSIAVADSDGLADIAVVEAFLHGTLDSATALPLRDDGGVGSGDLAAGDGIFSAIVWLRPAVALSQVVFEYRATDAELHASPPVYRALQNRPPEILYLDVPDSIQRPSSGSSLIPFYLAAADPDGPGDIDSVYFFNATSTPPPLLVAMYDDGNLSVTGDSTAGDGVFSRIVQITSSNTTGLKEFHFLVVDRAGDRTELVKDILVY